MTPDFYANRSGFTASREQLRDHARLVAARYLADRDLADYRAPTLPVTLPQMERTDDRTR